MSPWADPRRRMRLAMMVLTGVALILAATAFAYAVIANQRASEHAQTTASQAKAGQLYGLQLFCTQLRVQENDRDTTRAELAKLEHYDAELDCDAALSRPLVPLGQTGAHLPPRSPSPTPSGRALPTPGASVRSPPPPPTRNPPPPRPTRSPTPTPTPTRSPSASPSPVPSVCVTVGPVHRCIDVGASAAHARRHGRHFGRGYVLD